uniref:Mitochondrial mRNA-processing protein COX24 C-terminal domain-containing protein n=1 Tax=Angiostrongylus cantonensis TaxID=6313 RepID=A0A0K0DD83_ANGCA
MFIPAIFTNRKNISRPRYAWRLIFQALIVFFSVLDLCDISGSFRRPSAYDLPALENGRRVYTFPTLHRGQVVLPSTFLGETVEKMDPLAEKICVHNLFLVQFKIPMETPPQATPISIQLAPRLLTIRRKKMKKHKRRKRYDRDFFKYQKYHREKKLRREFVRRMKAHLAELQSFEPEKYVEDTIATAKKEWSDELAPTGRKLYPHWSRLISLEELYGLPKSDYIDKKAGFPSEEDMEKIKKLKMEYENKFRGV